ncbi:hypothetical protein [Azospirillum sp. TSO35-2]|uniref:hypothetical protein n=1 Tax=Azospirillum sp. TSO35-2 TaxID=716796 RepID=UPI000D604D31|nr:hypothetical protein [Azospirillum sp. TSO35-2]PWC37780.1 hypothetical protein TSO352_09890 [Azospirillum sp. TSO35-2]
MPRTRLLHGVAALLLSAAPAIAPTAAPAQEIGGIGFGPEGVSAANLAQAFAQPARQPVFASATRRGAPPGAMVTNPGKSRTEFHQQMIAKTRGDAGYLAGFHQGTPLAASRNPPPDLSPSLTFIDAPFIVNNINSALNIAIGEGNSTDQGVLTGNGDPQPAPQATPQPMPQPEPATATADTTSATPAARHERRRSRTPAAPQMPAAPQVPATPQVPSMPNPIDQPGALATTLGPLPYLGFAMKNGGVQFNNANSAVNIAAGAGNVAAQRVKTIQR